MKKILFCLQNMNMGGVEKELIAVLKKIHRDFDITLLLLYQEDKEILAEIPDTVNIHIVDINKEYYIGNLIHLANQRIKKGKIAEATGIILKRILGLGMTGANINLSNIAPFDEFFDTAICYHIHSPLLFKYVAEKVKAKKKIAWIHSDFYGSNYCVQRLKRIVVMYDEFVAVSKKVEHEFRTLCPWYQGEISTAYNYLDADEIIELSKDLLTEEIYKNIECNKLLTIGRFSKEKGIDYAIKTAALLKENNLNFHWFLIGYGELEDQYRMLIDKYDISDCFTILGKKTNPYPYIRNCDIYVQPSRHEAFGLVIKEAKILKRPIVCTNFAGADEQINNGINGIIVPLEDLNALYEALLNLINSSETRWSLSMELEKWNPEDDLREIVKHFEL